MELAASQSRTSRCREWERNRRNKFNDAITRLGKAVQDINKTVNDDGIETDNIQSSPKVEIVEKAILCLANCAQEKTQLKAEILSLQVKIESFTKPSVEKKDATTQVFIALRKKKQDGKYIKVVALKKSKRNALKEKPVLTNNVKVEIKTSKANEKGLVKCVPKPPNIFLLPKPSYNGKKGPENTIVVLPAAPYTLFPPRPLLLPTGPPAFVLVDPNISSLNKHTFPQSTRNNNDITKTTMVNILPISAYSGPLSAAKPKKTIKSKMDGKRTTKKTKVVNKTRKQNKTIPNSSKAKLTADNNEQSKENVTNSEKNKDDKSETKQPELPNVVKVLSVETTTPVNIEEVSKKKNNDIVPEPNLTIIEKDTIKENPPNCKESAILVSENSNVVKRNSIVDAIETNGPKLIENKICLEKETLVEDKDKENKLPNILDATLCESTVDGGNARLELAEEFLAASPTAAFLMSFPLVSGNRADSPTEETQNTITNSVKDNQRRNEIITQPVSYYEKPPENKKPDKSIEVPSPNLVKQNHQKYTEHNVTSKQSNVKATSGATTTSNSSTENPFLNLSMPSLITTSCVMSDSTFNLDFDCSISKSMPTQSTSFTNNNLFYKNDPFSNVKSTIYSTSSISSGHDFNSFGLYPCAMEKYSSKNKLEYPNVDENLMKIGSSRLTYDIDLGWKGFDFVNCTNAPNTFSKDTAPLTTTSAYSSSYNPFSADFHVPLTSTSNKKDVPSSKTSFPDPITSLYSQPTNLWSEEAPFYTNNNSSKPLPIKHTNYLQLDQTLTNTSKCKSNPTKQYEVKHTIPIVENTTKAPNIAHLPDKYTKKSPSKMHINWMTSEIRPMQNCNPIIQTHSEMKDTHKTIHTQVQQPFKKQDVLDANYFPINMPNFPTQTTQEEICTWPSSRQLGTTEISIEPPPINLPTLVGDLALGPHDKRKNAEMNTNRGISQPDIQNCSNSFSVTQLMNRSSDVVMPSRYQGPNAEISKTIQMKHNITPVSNDNNRKTMARLESQIPQPCYAVNEPKNNSYEVLSHFPQTKIKKADKTPKIHKNSYSAESLIRGGTCSQKVPDISNAKFPMAVSQKYGEFNVPQDNSVAQVSHFPPILDYSDNTYPGQQYSGTTLYNSTTNTISNSFYSNFMPGSSNLMASNYGGGPFTGDFIDYNQTTECNFTNHKYEELKMRNNPIMFQQEKTPTNYKTSRRESTAKHKLECSKKESSKKYQSKRAKVNNEVEEWNDTSHLLWQNKTPTKRHSNLASEELSFPNYVTNQMPGQYQPEFFNSHLMPSNMQAMGANVDRSLPSFPVTSRANFNLSTIFPEITMKVQ